MTFDLDCDILFSEHVTTSSLFVSQLQLEVFHAPFVYRVSVNPTTFREEPVFLLAFLDNMNEMGEAKLDDVSGSFAKFYEDRVEKGLSAEKKKCIFTKGSYSQHDVEKLILSMSFKRYEDMHIMHHSKQLGINSVLQDARKANH